MVAEIGDVVALFFDSTNRVEPGHYLRTGTGRTYRAVSVRTQQRGAHIGRQHIQAEVVDSDEVDPADTVHRIHWYIRGTQRVRLTRRAHRLIIGVACVTAFAFGVFFPYVLIPG